ncbi:tetratricopeptide repeat protein [Desulforhopalus sp. 52FAK]
MIEKYPISIGNRELLVDDYTVFSSSFAEILIRHIPTVKSIHFFADVEQFLASDESFSTDQQLADSFERLQQGGISYLIYKGYILLGLPVVDGLVVAVLTGADFMVLQKASKDWIIERIDLAEREFHLLKQARVDTQTGLLNTANLYSLLDFQSSANNLLVALVELPPVSTGFRHCIKYTHQCVTLLKGFVRGGSILHYLGHNTYALVLRQGEDKKNSTLESNLVAYLKKAGCHRVHVGSSVTLQDGIPRSGSFDGTSLLDEAYTALHRASRRGPFSFCEYQHIAYPENQTLAVPNSAVVRKIGRWCSSLDSFSLVLFQGDNQASSASQCISPLVVDHKTITVGDNLYVLYFSGDAREIQESVDLILDEVKDESNGVHISAGITCYPYANIRKSEAPFCCKKALLHAAFFGPSSSAVFDHVTLNISGDVYFGDGDFTLAIKEYKRGISCFAGDVNLYNSLGVTLAMMNRTKQANDSFKEALVLDQENFMALYNLGLSKQGLGLNNKAVEYLSRAYDASHAEDVDPYLLKDLTLQLGILSCETGHYDAALKYIESWIAGEGETVEAGRLYYYQGLSYFKCGNTKEAIRVLERALRFDGFDDRSLNLLGRLYLEEREGEDIAVTYCQKSVELDPDNAEYKLYLAEIYVSIGRYAESRELLGHCLRRKALQPYAQLLMGEGYLNESQCKRAASWFNKVMQQNKLDTQIEKRAKQGLRSCDSILRKEK